MHGFCSSVNMAMFQRAGWCPGSKQALQTCNLIYSLLSYGSLAIKYCCAHFTTIHSNCFTFLSHKYSKNYSKAYRVLLFLGKKICVHFVTFLSFHEYCDIFKFLSNQIHIAPYITNKSEANIPHKNAPTHVCWPLRQEERCSSFSAAKSCMMIWLSISSQ